MLGWVDMGRQSASAFLLFLFFSGGFGPLSFERDNQTRSKGSQSTRLDEFYNLACSLTQFGVLHWGFWPKNRIQTSFLGHST